MSTQKPLPTMASSMHDFPDLGLSHPQRSEEELCVGLSLTAPAGKDAARCGCAALLLLIGPFLALGARLASGAGPLQTLLLEYPSLHHLVDAGTRFCWDAPGRGAATFWSSGVLAGETLRPGPRSSAFLPGPWV